MHTVPQNKDKFTINDLFYCCEGLIFTHSLVYEFLCGLIFMAHPVCDFCARASFASHAPRREYLEGRGGGGDC